MHATTRLRRSVSTLVVAGAVGAATLVGTSSSASATVATAVTSAATSVTSSSATLNGSVNPNGLSTTYYFQYGTTAAYGSATATFAAGAGLVVVAANATASGLLANTTYYFQLVANNASGTSLGGQLTLFTSASTGVTANRVSGSDRYQTAVQIAETKYPGGVPSGAVVIATGLDFPDALAGNYLAGQVGGPILLTPSSAQDPAFATVTAALTALGATHVYILGGTSAVGSDVETALAQTYTVTRIAGTARYDTMQQIDTALGYTPSTGISGGRTAIIATGQGFPDALAAGPLSWADKFPLILTDGTQTTLSSQALAVISSLGITHFIVLGGSSSINPAQITQLATLGTIDVQLSGVDRTDTAAQFANYEQSTYSFGKSSVILATGADFPDALAAGPWGGDPQSIYFSLGADALGTYTTAALAALNGFTTVINIAGGSTVLDDNASAAAVTAVEGGGSGTLAPTAITDAASSITATTATLNGTVNPEGSTTTYSFQYGPTTSLGFTSTTQTVLAATGLQAASVTVSGLTTGSVYYFRLVATNLYGTTYGLTQSFTATNSSLAPLATTTAASSVSSQTATVNGSVNPDGTSTTYSFEYGTTTLYELGSTASTPAGAGSSSVPVSANLSNLSPATLYYVQLVAVNAYGTTDGGQTTFTTAAANVPVVSSLAITGGSTAGGTSVTVNGSNFTGATAVDFGATAGTGVVVNGGGTQLTVNSPMAGSAGAVDVTVTTPNGTSATSSNDQYTYVAPPTMASAVVTPGTYAGSTAGTVLVTFSEAVSCNGAGDYRYSNGPAVTFSTCTPVGSAPTTQFVFAPTNGTTLLAGGGGTLTYTQAAPTTGNATYAPAGNSQVFETSGDARATT